jgi:hypothetical protein
VIAVLAALPLFAHRLKLVQSQAEAGATVREMGEFKEFPVAAEYIKDRRLALTWDRPDNERQLDWRRRSRLAEVWLIKEAAK